MKKLPYLLVGATLAVALASVQVKPLPHRVDLDASFDLQDEATSHAPSVVFTPDGRMLTATSAGEIVEFETATRKLLRRIRLPEEGTDAVTIEASGRYAAWALKSGGVALMDIRTERVVARDGSLEARWLAASPDRRALAVAHGSTLRVLEIESLQPVRTLKGHAAEITGVTWSADGKRLASVAKDGRLLIHAREAVELEVKKAAPLYAVAFHPSGRRVAYGGSRRSATAPTGSRWRWGTSRATCGCSR